MLRLGSPETSLELEEEPFTLTAWAVYFFISRIIKRMRNKINMTSAISQSPLYVLGEPSPLLYLMVLLYIKYLCISIGIIHKLYIDFLCILYIDFLCILTYNRDSEKGAFWSGPQKEGEVICL